jgi:hypothetical protein
MIQREFKCEVCGEFISSWGDLKDTLDVCQLCRWLNDNEHLTADERETLREKLRSRTDDQNQQSG